MPMVKREFQCSNQILSCGDDRFGECLYPSRARTIIREKDMGNSTEDNGLKTFSMHEHDVAGVNRVSLLRAARTATAEFSLPTALPLTSLSAESAAVRYVRQALQSDAIPEMPEETSLGTKQEFKTLGTEAVPLTGTNVVKFRQTINKVPVYGSLVSVELDDQNELVSLNSSLGDPGDVGAVASVSPADAIRIAGEKGGAIVSDDSAPRLNFYFSDDGKWHLVYIVENVPVPSKRAALFNIVVDAHSGNLLATLPRTASLQVAASDGLGDMRQFNVGEFNGNVVLRDVMKNVHTYDFGFEDPDTNAALLPGKYVKYVQGLDPMAVSAHANAAEVVDFLRTVLMRQGIDNKGGPLVSTINCVVRRDAKPGNVWFNAYWDGAKQQMVYGQVLVKGKLRSLATSLDVVTHEIFHGVTDQTANLEYTRQSGALNEALSDIFGVIVSNLAQPIAQWDWEIGDDLEDEPLRDMADPTKFDQPKHMDQFVRLPNTEDGDWGGVHTNSGIINYAAYLIINSKKPDGAYLFTAAELAGLFYYALSQILTATSNFSNFRAAVESAGKSLFRRNLEADIKARLAAIAQGFDRVGIVTP